MTALSSSVRGKLVSKAATFPSALTPRSVRLAKRKREAATEPKAFTSRRAAMSSDSTVRSPGCLWEPMNARPS